MIDFHTHILPNMDDGSDSIETSIEMLNKLEEDGVTTVCLTSHFYHDYESIDDFLRRREESYNSLNYKGTIKLLKGCEVRFYNGMSFDNNLSKLCLEGTNIILIELPFEYEIDRDIVNEIVKIKLSGLDVCLAHIERYRIKQEILDYMHNSGIKFQMNASNFNGFFSLRKAMNMVKNKYISYLGSDCHNMIDRSPNFIDAILSLRKVFKEDDLSLYIERLYNF